MKKQLTLEVNGQSYEVEVEANRLLLQVLRDTIGLTGTKEGCSIGVCGACSVIIDGRLVQLVSHPRRRLCRQEDRNH